MARPGNLDQRITFQEQVRTPDGAGGSTLAFQDIADTPTVWARAYPVSGNEAETEGRTNAAAVYRFTIRNRHDINETHRILWDGLAYNIRNAPPQSRREMYMDIQAERGVAS